MRQNRVSISLSRLKDHARRLKAELGALHAAAWDPRTPWYAKLLAAIVIGYALSPIDLIPDFIPVLGLLDDLLLVPLGLYAVRRLIPAHVLAEHRQHIDTGARLPANRWAGAIVVLLWVAGGVAAGLWAWGWF